MSKKVYLARNHYIVKALSDINYPITKKEIIEKVGDKKIKVNWDEYKELKEILKPIKLKKFENAAEFYSALHATNN